MQLCFMAFFFNYCRESFLTLGILAHMRVVLVELLLLLLPFLGMFLLHVLVKFRWSNTSPPVVFIHKAQEAFILEFVGVHPQYVHPEAILVSEFLSAVVPLTFVPL